MKYLNNIYNYTKEDLEIYFESIGEKKFRATQVFKAVYDPGFTSFEEVSTLAKSLRSNLTETMQTNTLKLVTKLESASTVKFLFELSDGETIETVVMKHNYGNSVCVTTQVGCMMGCKFCASGLLKKVRDLQTHEIVEQVLFAQKELGEERISHVVVMGIGEPFDNFENVMNFVSIINSDLGLCIGARHITISTSGLVDKIVEFSDMVLQYNLAISLHAATDEKRSRLMPINNKYNLAQLKSAMKYYNDMTNRRLTIEYILIKGVNDSAMDATALIEYLRGVHCYVNLIPINVVDESGFERPSKAVIDEFYNLLAKNNINVQMRREFGEDINAACGQLRAKR